MNIIRYKTSKVLIEDILLEGVVSMELPQPHYNVLEDEFFGISEQFLTITCMNQNYPHFKQFFEKEIEIKIIHDDFSHLYIVFLLECKINYERRIYESELYFQVLHDYDNSKCCFCNKYGMKIENLNRDGIVYNTCKFCGKTWYEWDEFNEELKGKNIFEGIP